MTRQDIAKLACRIIALWLFCQAAIGLYTIFVFILQAVFQSANGDNVEFDYAGSIVPALMFLGTFLMGALLWWKSDWISRKMIPDATTTVLVGPITTKDALSVALSVVGILIIVDILPKLCRVIYVAYKDSEHRQDVKSQASIIGDIIKLLLGIWILFGSRGIANLIRRFCSPGSPESSENLDR
jgi:hypothetical protein